MSRLIDADKMILRYQSHPNRHSKTYLSSISYEDVIDAVIYDLEQEPTVDAVPVVRCKDCKWYNTTASEKCVAYDAFWATEPDDYCAWGERREDEQTQK